MSVPRPPYGRSGAPAETGAPVRLGHLVPERRAIVVTRPNPEWTSLAADDPKRDQLPEMVDVILQGYVYGSRCPGVVKAELASIEQAYLEVVQASAATDGSPADASAFVVAWHTFLRETIQALVPGLTAGEADVLAAVPPGEDGPGTDLLRQLGVWRPAMDAADADPPDPEAPGAVAPPTTAPSSPILPPSTDSAPTSS